MNSATLLAGIGALFLAALPLPAAAASPGYDKLTNLFRDWRRFDAPTYRRGVPDYSPAMMAAKAAALPQYRKRLAAIDPSHWTRAEQVDWRLVEAEMNGLDFHLRVLKPWARDPAFYANVWAERTDVPAREGSQAEPPIDLYDYHWPLAARDQAKLTRQLQALPRLLDAARTNLKDANAGDLWHYGARPFRNQANDLAALEAGTLEIHTLALNRTVGLTGASPALRRAVADARRAMTRFADWIDAEAPRHTGPSGVGKADYNWYLRHVKLVPYDWDQQVTLLKRELDRAWASLKLEEFRNRKLPPIEPAATPEAYRRLSEQRLDKFARFLVDEGVIADSRMIRPALEAQIGHFVPPEKRAFFAQATHREPMALYSHDYHWFDLARMRDAPNPSEIRRDPLLYNVWESRAEGFATAFEEILLHAGLYDDNPRGREVIWVMLANRAARGLASLYVQANLMSLEEGGRFQSAWTPRGWALASGELTAFEQTLYLREPGYGTSYITGKLLADRLMADVARAQAKAGQPFVLKDFMTRFENAGLIPTALIDYDLTGRDPLAGEVEGARY